MQYMEYLSKRSLLASLFPGYATNFKIFAKSCGWIPLERPSVNEEGKIEREGGRGGRMKERMKRIRRERGEKGRRG
jgi:hypothetical protein